MDAPAAQSRHEKSVPFRHAGLLIGPSVKWFFLIWFQGHSTESGGPLFGQSFLSL